ncbi:hypothetical protein PAXRUDRAFT_836379 [Paxillus rubicundulus Ve08.2h10]|uniref:Uncharacterized protein n=1 Tax=Paxillus rubicundulus Ve08.2h10 TaxID=930991 RepID=A0A0D0BM71_9AGAM|nr:hypothetical protein PAXRUDRAFT_836379 [Paxillus rubicundulus Ve08.2h10]
MRLGGEGQSELWLAHRALLKRCTRLQDNRSGASKITTLPNTTTVYLPSLCR